MSNPQRKYNESIAPMFKSKSLSGNFVSLTINEEMLQQLAKVVEGDRILLKLMPEERRKHENSPHAYLEIQKPDAEYKPKQQQEEV